jgi:hypothetical protein
MPAHNHPLLGKWRIVEMELWDSDFLDLIEPAYIEFDRQGGGAFVFGAVYGSLDCSYGPEDIGFTWQGSDEMDRPAVTVKPSSTRAACWWARSASTGAINPPSKRADGDFLTARCPARFRPGPPPLGGR